MCGRTSNLEKAVFGEPSRVCLEDRDMQLLVVRRENRKLLSLHKRIERRDEIELAKGLAGRTNVERRNLIKAERLPVHVGQAGGQGDLIRSAWLRCSFDRHDAIDGHLLECKRGGHRNTRRNVCSRFRVKSVGELDDEARPQSSAVYSPREPSPKIITQSPEELVESGPKSTTN